MRDVVPLEKIQIKSLTAILPSVSPSLPFPHHWEVRSLYKFLNLDTQEGMVT